jgi:hypothetical protein
MRALPRLLDDSHKIVRGGLVEELLTGSWRRLVLPGSERIDKTPTCFVLNADSLSVARAENVVSGPVPGELVVEPVLSWRSGGRITAYYPVDRPPTQRRDQRDRGSIQRESRTLPGTSIPGGLPVWPSKPSRTTAIPQDMA